MTIGVEAFAGHTNPQRIALVGAPPLQIGDGPFSDCRLAAVHLPARMRMARTPIEWRGPAQLAEHLCGYAGAFRNAFGDYTEVTLRPMRLVRMNCSNSNIAI
jgi:hypothetical protein